MRPSVILFFSNVVCCIVCCIVCRTSYLGGISSLCVFPRSGMIFRIPFVYCQTTGIEFFVFFYWITLKLLQIQWPGRFYFFVSQVVTVQDYWVKPRSADINENVLSEQAREEMGLSEELIRTKGNSLEQVLSQVRQSWIFIIYTIAYPLQSEKKNLLGDFDARGAVRELSGLTVSICRYISTHDIWWYIPLWKKIT